jgi:hypothetical protein
MGFCRAGAWERRIVDYANANRYRSCSLDLLEEVNDEHTIAVANPPRPLAEPGFGHLRFRAVSGRHGG